MRVQAGRAHERWRRESGYRPALAVQDPALLYPNTDAQYATARAPASGGEGGGAGKEAGGAEATGLSALAGYASEDED